MERRQQKACLFLVKCNIPGIRRLAMWLFLGWAFLIAGLNLGGGRAEAVEMCSPQGKNLMQQAGVTQKQITRVCELARMSASPFVISVRRAEEELGYCRVTLKLENRSTDYLNQLALSTENSLFEIFQFHNVLPGTIGYTSARSKVLLGCDELKTLKLNFHWPASLRVADRAAFGPRLERYKPVFNDKQLGWISPGKGEK